MSVNAVNNNEFMLSGTCRACRAAALINWPRKWATNVTDAISIEFNNSPGPQNIIINFRCPRQRTYYRVLVVVLVVGGNRPTIGTQINDNDNGFHNYARTTDVDGLDIDGVDTPAHTDDRHRKSGSGNPQQHVRNYHTHTHPHTIYSLRKFRGRTQKISLISWSY